MAELIAEEASSSPDRPATPSKNQVGQTTPLFCHLPSPPPQLSPQLSPLVRKLWSMTERGYL